MSNDKTLATAKHGGCVQLSTSERKRFEAWAISRGWSIQRCEDGLRRYCSCDTEKMWEAFQAALSAQPSPASSFDLEAMLAACVPGGSIVDPQVIADNIRQWFAAQPSPATCKEGLQVQPSSGGQGDALVDTARRNIRQFISKASFSSSVDKQAALSCVDVLEEALAARQPVAVPLAAPGEGEWSKGWNCCREAFLRGEVSQPEDAHQPVGEPVAYKFQDRTADGCWTDQYWHKLPPWEHRNPIPLYAAPPAQAVDLGQFREAVQEAYENADAGTLNKFSLEELLGLIDSQAVGK